MVRRSLVLWMLLIPLVCGAQRVVAADADENAAYAQSALCLHDVNQLIWKEARGELPDWWKDAGDRTDPTKLHLGDNFFFNRTPIVLVHGMEDAPGSWNPGIEYLAGLTVQRLEKTGGIGVKIPVPQIKLLPERRAIRDNYFFVTYTYNSRLHVPLNGLMLKKRLAEWHQASGGHPGFLKPVIIAHSMGGVVSRAYIDQAWDPKHPDQLCVDKLITIATPHLGSSAADVAWDVYIQHAAPLKDAMGSLPGSLVDSWFEAASGISIKHWVEYGGKGVGDICYMSPYIKHLLESPADKAHRHRYMYGGAYVHYARDPLGLLKKHNPMALFGLVPVITYLAQKHKVFDHANDGLVPFHSQLFFRQPSQVDFAMGQAYGSRPGNCFYVQSDHMGALQPKGAREHLWKWIAEHVGAPVPATSVIHPDPKPDTRNQAWMSSMRKVIGPWQLNQLVIPGTHDSGTADITPSSPLAMDGNLPFDKVDNVLRGFGDINLNQLLNYARECSDGLKPAEDTLKRAEEMLTALEAALDELGGANARSQKIDIPGWLKDRMEQLKNALNDVKAALERGSKLGFQKLQEKWNEIKGHLTRLGVAHLKELIRVVKLEIKLLRKTIASLRAIIALAANWAEFIPKALMARWSVTTDHSVGEQLRQGIRYFDLRIEQTGGGDQFWNTVQVVHALRSTRMGLIVRDLKNFLRDSTTRDEIVLLDFNHIYGFHPEAHKGFLAWLRSELKDARGRSLLIPRQQPLPADCHKLARYADGELSKWLLRKIPPPVDEKTALAAIAKLKLPRGGDQKLMASQVSEMHDHYRRQVEHEHAAALDLIKRIRKAMDQHDDAAHIESLCKAFEKHMRSIAAVANAMGTCSVRTGIRREIAVPYSVDTTRFRKSAGGVYWRTLKMRDAVGARPVDTKSFDLHARNTETELSKWMPRKIPAISKQTAEAAVAKLAQRPEANGLRVRDLAQQVLAAHDRYRQDAEHYRVEALSLMKKIRQDRAHGVGPERLEDMRKKCQDACYHLDRLAKAMGRCKLHDGSEIVVQVAYATDARRLQKSAGDTVWRALKMQEYLRAAPTSLVLNDLWKQPGRVIVFYKDRDALAGWDGRNWFWPCGTGEGAINSTVDHMYLDTLDLKKLIHGLQEQLRERDMAKEVKARRFFLSQAILSSGSIPDLARWFCYGHSLRTMARDAGNMSANPALIKLFLGRDGTYAYPDGTQLDRARVEPLPRMPEFQEKANILYLNWFDRSFVDAVITMNHRRFDHAGRIMLKAAELKEAIEGALAAARSMGKCVLDDPGRQGQVQVIYEVRGEKRSGNEACRKPLYAAAWHCRRIASLLEGAQAKIPPGDVVTQVGLIRKAMTSAREATPWKLKQEAAKKALAGYGGADAWPADTPGRIVAAHEAYCRSYAAELKKGEALIEEIQAVLDKWMEQAGVEL